jgi:hypothetical protein
MPTQLFADFCDGMYQTRAPIMGTDQAINVYTESRQIPGSPKQVVMYGTPGLLKETTLNDKPCRGWFTQDNRTWVVNGSTLYERTAPATYVVRGSITNDGLPVSFASNGAGGTQLAVVGGGQILVQNLLTNATTYAALPFTNPVMIVFQDGYGLVNQLNSPLVWFSAIEDLTSWDALDFFARSVTSDNVVGLANTRDRVFVLGSRTTTLYYDSGNALNPWVPYPGTSSQVGCAMWTTISVYNDVVRWMGQSPRGEARIYQSRSDMNVQIISTPPIEDVLISCSTLSDVESLFYEQAGHPFIAFTLPSCPTQPNTYVYDVTESQIRQSPQWHARATLDPTTMQYARWRARGTTATNLTVFAGDYATGDVYMLDLGTYTDNGTLIRRERIAPFFSTDNQWVFVDQVELGTQAGNAPTLVGQGSKPVTELQISRDGGQTFISAGFGAIGAMGQYLTRCLWRRLGRARADRVVFRTIQTDPSPCVWGPGIYLTTSQGTGQL